MSKLSMKDKIVKADKESLELYSRRKIDFDELKRQIEEHNGVKLHDWELERLLKNSGYEL